MHAEPKSAADDAVPFDAAAEDEAGIADDDDAGAEAAGLLELLDPLQAAAPRARPAEATEAARMR
jgi:hypothetical protein